jgi:hypothetical protein
MIGSGYVGNMNVPYRLQQVGGHGARMMVWWSFVDYRSTAIFRRSTVTITAKLQKMPVHAQASST